MVTPFLSRGEEYRYCIIGDPSDYFFSGLSDTGHQVLFVIRYPLIVGIFFDQEGNLVSVQQRPLSESTRALAERVGIDEAFSHQEEELASWMHSIAFRSDMICVKRFFLPGYHIGIRDFPQLFTEILKNPDHYSVDERRVAESELRRWSSRGLFELWLNESANVWIDESGTIEAS